MRDDANSGFGCAPDNYWKVVLRSYPHIVSTHQACVVTEPRHMCHASVRARLAFVWCYLLS